MLRATVVVFLTTFALGDKGLRRLADGPWDISDFLEGGNGTKHLSGPYQPSPIHDPFSDINCKEEACSKDNHCSEFPYRLCRKYPHCVGEGYPTVCLHKNLFPMLQEDVLLFVLMFCIAVCAGAAGIGGGGLNVPVLMMVSSFGIKEAVPLSHAAVMGNSLAQLLFNFKLRHPSAPQRPLIHYELAILALPAQLGGNSLGVVIGRVFPPTLLIILSLVMLAIAATKTFIKGMEVFGAYRAKQRPAQASLTNVRPTDGSLPLVPTRASGANPTSSPARNLSQDLRLPTSTAQGVECIRTWSGTMLPRIASPGNANALSPQGSAREVEIVVDQVPMRIPWKVVMCMIAFNVIFCLDFLAMATDVSGVVKCSPLYWVTLLGLYPFVIASLWVGLRSLKELKLYHEQRGDPPIAGDPEVTTSLIVLFPLAAVIIGLIAGLVGLGGGEFMVPLLLEFGLLPRVASGTSGFLILFATSSDIVHYLVAGIMEPFILYGVGVFIVAFLGAAVGLIIRDTRFMKEHSYLLVFMLAGLLALSGGLLGWRGFGMSTLDWSFKNLCGS